MIDHGGGNSREKQFQLSVITSLIWIFLFSNGELLLAYLATFSGQLFFRTLLQSNCFNRTVTLLEPLFLQNSCFFKIFLFERVIPLQQLFFQNTSFFGVELLPSSHFLRIGNSLGQLLFGTATEQLSQFLLLKVTISYQGLASTLNSLGEGIAQNKDAYRRGLLLNQALMHSISVFYIFEKVNFSEKKYSAFSTFSEELLFQSSHFFKRHYLLQQLPFQKSYFLTTYFSEELLFHSYASSPQLHLLFMNYVQLKCGSSSLCIYCC